MAVTDPQIITVNAVAKSMPRIANSGPTSMFEMSDKTFSLSIKHTSFKQDKKSRVKSLVVFTQRAVVADPLTAINDYETCSVSCQIDRPEAGFTQTQIEQLVTGFQSWLNTAMVDKLYGREQ